MEGSKLGLLCRDGKANLTQVSLQMSHRCCASWQAPFLFVSRKTKERKKHEKKKEEETNHSLSSTFRENKQICIDKPRMCTPWETICAVKGGGGCHRISRTLKNLG